jgi:hypothetical protein
MPDKIRAWQWGAFDVENYGDHLFPLIANEQLTARLPNLELMCHAPIGHAAVPLGAPAFPPGPGWWTGGLGATRVLRPALRRGLDRGATS